jgi:hypothetical protein
MNIMVDTQRWVYPRTTLPVGHSCNAAVVHVVAFFELRLLRGQGGPDDIVGVVIL